MAFTGWVFAGQAVGDARDTQEQLKEWDIEAAQLLKMANRFTVNRGRSPSVGYLLMTKAQLLNIRNTQRNIHTLSISDGVRAFDFGGLCVVKSRAIWPGVDRMSSNPSTPYLVTVADARFKAHLGFVNEGFNRRPFFQTGEQAPAQQPQSARDIVRKLWESIEGLLGRVRFDVTDEQMYDVGFYGVSAWEAIWHVLNTVGWTLRWDSRGRMEVIQFVNQSTPFNDATSKMIVDGEFFLERPVMPRKIEVCVQNRDYQWQTEDEAFTGEDKHRLKPAYTKDFSTVNWQSALTPSSGEHPSIDIASHREGTMHVWCPSIAVWDDNGVLVNQEPLHDLMEKYARRAYDQRLMQARANSYTFAGLVPMNVSSRWGSVTFHDDSRERVDEWDETGGIHTTISSCPVDWQEPWKPGTDFRPGSVNMRDWAPYSRDAYLKVTDTMGPQPPPTIGPDGEPEPPKVGPDQLCRVVLRSGQVTGTTVQWQDQAPAIAVNGTGKPINLDQVCFGKWNYQLGQGGLWVIVAAGAQERDPEDPPPFPGYDPDFTDWQVACVDGVDIGGASNPPLVVLDKSTMFKMLAVAGGNVAISMQHGPSWTGLNTRGENKIFWSTIPSYDAVNCWIGQVQFGQPNAPNASVTTGGVHDILPEFPGRSHKYAIAEAVGPNTVDWGWFGPGANYSAKVPKPLTAEDCENQKACDRKWLTENLLDYLCDYISNCEEYGSPLPPGEDWWDGYEEPYGDGLDCACSDQEYKTLTFENGLLMSPGDLPPEANTGPAFMWPNYNYNPCEDGNDAIDPPPVEPPPGQPDRPDGPDPDDPDAPFPEPDDNPIPHPPIGGPVVACDTVPPDVWGDPCFPNAFYVGERGVDISQELPDFDQPVNIFVSGSDPVFSGISTIHVRDTAVQSEPLPEATTIRVEVDSDPWA